MAEKLNGPGFGARMAMAVTQAPSFDKLKEHLQEIAAASAASQDAFRQLLSYCETEADDWPEDVILTPGDAYRDIAGKLRNLLDGE